MWLKNKSLTLLTPREDRGFFFGLIMKKLWQKQYSLNKFAEQYCSGSNVVLDNVLISQEVLGSMAHVQMLTTIGVLTSTEEQKLHVTLNAILNLASKGEFSVNFGDEDIHTKVECYLTDKLGDLGKKIQTGRSRNDQINVDLKLYTKEKIIWTSQNCLHLVKSFLSFATKYEFIPMPGYTHMQKAMPSSVGLWATSFAESLLDDCEILKTAFNINDQSPLGSGAAYGVSLPINRELTAKLLGFSKVQNNSLYSQVSRCKNQYIALHALSQIMLTLSRFAQDILLFTMSEFDFFTIPQELCTGSSIMPQKKNVDIMEILKARAHVVTHSANLNGSILSGLPSGYNADFAETKQSLINGFQATIDSITIVNILVDVLKPNKKKLRASNTKEVYATHAAYLLVKKGVPFREAYNKIAKSLDILPEFDPDTVIRDMTHSGATGNLQLKGVLKQCRQEIDWWKKTNNKFQTAINSLRGTV